MRASRRTPAEYLEGHSVTVAMAGYHAKQLDLAANRALDAKRAVIPARLFALDGPNS